MKTYQLFWGIYLQWTKQFSSDAEAVKNAEQHLSRETGWKLIRHEEITVR